MRTDDITGIKVSGPATIIIECDGRPYPVETLDRLISDLGKNEIGVVFLPAGMKVSAIKVAA